MLENLLLSLRTVLPIFLLVVVGMILKKLNFLPAAFYDSADKFVFKVALPSMIFLQVASSSLAESVSYIRLMLFTILLVCVFCLIYSLVTPLFVRDRRKVGAAVQGMFRSNVAILGVVLIENMFDDASDVSNTLTAFAVVVPFVILFYNILAVFTLTIFAPVGSASADGTGDGDGAAPAARPRLDAKTVGHILLETVKNPLIIAVVLGLPFMIFGFKLPYFASQTLTYLSNTTTALALVSLGAGFSFVALRGNIGLALVTASVKTAIQPTVALLLGYAVGFRSTELLIIFIVFGTPAAVSSYIMAKNMNSDHELAGQILLLTTVFCIVTFFVGTFIMRSIGWI